MPFTLAAVYQTNALAITASVRIHGINKRRERNKRGKGEKTNEYKIVKRKQY